MDINQSNLEEEVKQTQENIQENETTATDINEEEMTPEELIVYWKSLYKHIYLSVYDEQEFVWRKINRQEYAQIMDSVSEEDKAIDEVVEARQMMTLQCCLLTPNKDILPELLSEYPGILTSLTAEILKKSGFSKLLTVEI